MRGRPELASLRGDSIQIAQGSQRIAGVDRAGRKLAARLAQ